MKIFFDIGATKTRVACSRDGRKIDAKEIFQTRENFEDEIEELAKVSEKISAASPALFGGSDGKIEVVCGGVSASFYPGNSVIFASPNLPDWHGKPIKEAVEKRFGAPAIFENDAAVCGLGEAVFGAGKNFEIVMYITVSTGVGGARIVGGKIDWNAFGFQPGQQIIDADGTLCPSCNSDGGLEGHVSGAVAKRRFKTNPRKIINSDFWSEQARWLSYGLYNSVLHWSPEVVVLGGSMITGSPAIPVEKVEFHLKDLMAIFPEIPLVKKAELADDSGILGAMEYTRQSGF